MSRIRVLIAGGGTGGHLFPGIAVAEEIRARGGEVCFVGTERGIEARVLPRQGWPLELIRVRGLVRTGWRQRLRFGVEAPMTLLQVVRLLGRFRPDVVVGVGGYASGPVVLTAATLRLPTAILEQNSVPGITNRILGKVVKGVYAAFEESRHWFPDRKVEVLGNPVRQNIVQTLRAVGAGTTGTHNGVQVLAFGGSQGARFLNETLMAAAPRLAAAGLCLVHQTGEADLERVTQAYREAGFVATVVPFIEDMASAYAAADLILCRAGATTLAELAIVGRPAILVPFPFATHNHQVNNAQEFERAGAALCRTQDGLDGDTLADEVLRLAGDANRRAEMAAAMQELGRPRAAADIVDRLVGLGGRS